MLQNIFRRFSCLWIAMGLFFHMGPNNLMIFHAWVSRSHICEAEQNPVLTGFGINLRVMKRLHNFHILIVL